MAVRNDFAPGEVLQAQDVNDTFASKQADVMTTKGDLAAYGTAVDRLAVGTNGQVLTADSGETLGVKWADASSQKIVQVQSVTKTDVFTTTSTTFADVTGLSVSITPTSASNNILVLFSVMISDSGSTYVTRARLVRNSTAIYVGDTAGSRVPAAGRAQSATSNNYQDARIAGQHVDSPATTSATTYKIQVRTQSGGGGTSLVNRSFVDTDADFSSRYASSITVMEVTP